jgi:hypothetical protein
MKQLATPLVRQIVALYLGECCELDCFTWVNAPPCARRQVAHSDVEHTGSVAVFFPLHRIDKGDRLGGVNTVQMPFPTPF